MKRILTFLFATAVIAGTLAAGAVAHDSHSATLTIRHATKGCHTWSTVGAKASPTQRITLDKGATLRVINNDVMPHRFAQTKGAHLQIVHAKMNRPGATATVRFTKHGIYKFTTKAGEDYPGVTVKTVGEDYVLRLIVTVS